jgi:protein-tyrosine kinase
MEQLDVMLERAEPAPHGARPTHNRIGTLLREAGVLDHEAAERVALVQQREGGLFGQIAVQLYALSQDDIEQAMERQFGQHRLRRGHSNVSMEVLAAYSPGTPQLAPLRKLRSQLLADQHLSERHPTYAVTSANRGDGRSTLCANLAVLFAHLGKRTLLIDADLHHPRQHTLFGLSNRTGLSRTLAGRAPDELLQSVPDLAMLTILTAGAASPNPHELLGKPLLPPLLGRLSKQYEVILIDTAANAESGDAQVIAMGAKNALVLVRKNATASAATAQLVAELAAVRVYVPGCVLNDF